VQLLFTWNPSPLQSSSISLEYLLLPPRSALTAAQGGLSPHTFNATATTLLLVATWRALTLSVSNGWVWAGRSSAIHFQG